MLLRLQRLARKKRIINKKETKHNCTGMLFRAFLIQLKVKASETKELTKQKEKEKKKRAFIKNAIRTTSDLPWYICVFNHVVTTAKHRAKVFNFSHCWFRFGLTPNVSVENRFKGMSYAP